MNHVILWKIQKKKLDQPLWMLVCFATALSYVLSIGWMLFLPQWVIWTQRVVTTAALATVVGLFLPLGEEILRTLIYAQVFLCCFMIGFETFIMVNYFSKDSNIRHLTAAHGISLLMIAAVQNDFVPITFPAFRVLTVLAIVLLLAFLWCMPAGKETLPQYVKKKDGLRAPKKLLFGTCLLVFVGALMGVSGSSISGEVQHGVFVTYLVDALTSLGLYLLYKKEYSSFPCNPRLHGVGMYGIFVDVCGALCARTGANV